MSDLEAPWTDEQVTQLNRFQHGGYFHPFTCGIRDTHPDNEGILIATPEGWHCPVQTCPYRQAWCHDFMADKAWNDGMETYWAGLFADISVNPDGTLFGRPESD